MLISLKKSYYYLSKDNIIECQRIVHPMFFLSQFYYYCKSDKFFAGKTNFNTEEKHIFSQVFLQRRLFTILAKS
jgi:hypothetical protein